jgi:predicted nucleic acid-binding protein
MTSWVVIDSGIYLTLSLQEKDAPKAKKLFNMLANSGYTIATPYLFRYEITSVTRKHIASGKLTVADGRQLMEGILNQSIVTFTEEFLLRNAFELANQYNLVGAYDAQYLALANHLKCDLWTADRRLFNGVSSSLTWVHLLENFT